MSESGANPPRSERRDAAENRQRILDAAIRLFDREGVGQVSMNQIAAEAQIGPGTLYRRYRNKGDLCLDLIKDNLVLLFEDIEAYLRQHEAEPPSRRLRGVLGYFLRFREKKSQLLTGIEDSASVSKPRPRGQSPIYNELHGLLAELFDEMDAPNNAEPQLESVFKADMLIIALSGESYLFQRNVRGLTPDMILEQLCLTFIGPS